MQQSAVTTWACWYHLGPVASVSRFTACVLPFGNGATGELVSQGLLAQTNTLGRLFWRRYGDLISRQGWQENWQSCGWRMRGIGEESPRRGDFQA